MSDDLDAWLDANAALLGIPVQPEWRDAIRQHLRLTRDLAGRVMEFPLSDEADPAPIFRA
ncbi:MAG TPA: DUF4089 domain-containing protein [Acetobacteraceae bacterium]|jgi:hypothetical protein|nr:DUF4089 domain-containing protein [Acetobacteraceae bacterium]